MSGFHRSKCARDVDNKHVQTLLNRLKAGHSIALNCRSTATLQRVTSEPGFPPAATRALSKLPEEMRLSLYLMRERALGRESEWAPYISVLPQLVRSVSTWSASELGMLQDPELEEAALHGVKAEIVHSFNQLRPYIKDVMTGVDLKAANVLFAASQWDVDSGEALARLKRSPSSEPLRKS